MIASTGALSFVITINQFLRVLQTPFNVALQGARNYRSFQIENHLSVKHQVIFIIFGIGVQRNVRIKREQVFVASRALPKEPSSPKKLLPLRG